MMRLSFTEATRLTILDRFDRALRSYHASLAALPRKLTDRFPEDDRDLLELRNTSRRLWASVSSAESEYYEGLPRICISVCPFTGVPLYRSFDPYGLDGLWWRSDATPEEVAPGPYFCVLLGAVNFNGQPALAGDYEVHSGPQVPYVIPRLLEYPGMIAVISQLNMENGYVAYPVAYFAKRRPPPEKLPAGWARTNFVYTTQLGVHGWRRPAEKLDFDLLRWIQAGKVRWCAPNAESPTLSSDRPEQCPYLDLPGERRPVTIRGSDVIEPIDEQGLEE